MQYLINNSTFQATAYSHQETAEQHGDNLDVDFSIIFDSEDLHLYTNKELVEIYNNLGHSIKKFSSKADGQTKVFKALEEFAELIEDEPTPAEDHEPQSVVPDTTEEAPKRKSPVRKSKRVKGVGDLVRHMIYQGESTKAIVAACQAGYPENTTSSKDIAWWKWDLRNKELLDKDNQPTEKWIEMHGEEVEEEVQGEE